MTTASYPKSINRKFINIIFIFILVFLQTTLALAANPINKTQITEDLNGILTGIQDNYIYLQDKAVDLSCIKEKYSKKIDSIANAEQTVLFFEMLLGEFYDSHLILNTNHNSSFRLYSPIYTKLSDNNFIIASVWQSQIGMIDENIIGAKILKFNGVDFARVINDFPTLCQDKNHPEIKQWLANKVLAGRYNQPRVLTLKLGNNEIFVLDLDKLKITPEQNLLSSSIQDEIGIIRINNSLGNNNLVTEFDRTLDFMFATKGLIIDLRNTVDGGNSYVARGIMGRFTQQVKPYQKHWTVDKSDHNPDVIRSWVEYVSPRLKIYRKPIVILVGRWTGSMGEGIAIGFDAIGTAQIVGTEMAQLAGEMHDFNFKQQKYGFRLSTTKLFHVNGTAREKYQPKHYVQQTNNNDDEILNYGLKLLKASSI
ncbi:MAG: S41 family peptidase [Proteobacteria bacterium]|nr:S41 family peptidase [Pseudomonadota bacterium]